MEARTVAEQVVVMSRGRVMQVGAPEALFERPSHTFVGHFIGSPGMNFLPLQCVEGGMWVAGLRMAMPAGLEGAAAAQAALHLGIRPEYMRLAPAGSAGAVPAQVLRVQDVGTHMLLTATVDGQALKARFMADTALPAPGATVWLEVVNPHTCYYRNEELMA